MSKIYFICGFIGAGKTTYSKKLAKDSGAFRFSVDEWMIPLFGEHMEREVFDAHFETLTELFKESTLQLLPLGVPVIFDFGLWLRTDREKMIEWAKSIGAEYEVHYLDVPFDVCKQRAYERNEQLNGKSYEMTPEMLEMFWSCFEIPNSDEDVIVVN